MIEGFPGQEGESGTLSAERTETTDAKRSLYWQSTNDALSVADDKTNALDVRYPSLMKRDERHGHRCDGRRLSASA